MINSGVIALLLFAEDRQVGYDCHKSRLRTTMTAFVATRFSCGPPECCGSCSGRLRTTRVLGGFRGRLRTTKLPFWVG